MSLPTPSNGYRLVIAAGAVWDIPGGFRASGGKETAFAGHPEAEQ